MDVSGTHPLFENRIAVSCGCVRCMLPPPVPHMQYIKCMQATSRGLLQLLALPALVELQVYIFTDDLDPDDMDEMDGEVFHEIAYDRNEDLIAMLDELKALFAQHGRRLTSGRTR